MRTDFPEPLPAGAPRRDARLRGLALTVVVVAAGGIALAWIGDQASRPPAQPVAPDSRPESEAHAGAGRSAEIEQRFSQGVIMLHARQYQHAVAAFHRVLELAPDMPEAHVDMGFALIGLGRHAAALDFFESATALRPGQINAYYGMAIAQEGLGDLKGAIASMRTFVHLSSPDDPFVRKAEAALWEWQRAPEGPSQAPVAESAPDSAPRGAAAIKRH